MNGSAGACCVGCGGRFERDTATDTHPYMASSGGCWTAYGALLAREYQDAALFSACHRLTVDAYAVQHRGDADDPRAVRSVWLHFASLHAIFAEGRSLSEATDVIRRAVRLRFPPLPVGTPTWSMTLADVLAAPASDHPEAVLRWARAGYEAWHPLLAPGFPGKSSPA